MAEKEPEAAAGDDGDKKADNKTAANNQTIDYKGLNEEAQKKLPHAIPKGVRFLNVTGRFGNVYVNLIKKPNATVGLKDAVMHGMSYATGSVEFDLPSQKILT